ncbi:beta-propeller fold lactonase family protein [Pseudomonas cichorii]|uniref:beta-propeller fold lactonase family protein n=1 Tax=Pseudomonas cichorii TaxID=36746 RepID=UPI0018E638AF|nr:beta-propeller fold lactonase family protein [Pseudomonas cichorii]MBI6855373.1 beta-propeller fold lactonase family protein [Pseudomonas cichorii]
MTERSPARPRLQRLYLALEPRMMFDAAAVATATEVAAASETQNTSPATDKAANNSATDVAHEGSNTSGNDQENAATSQRTTALATDSGAHLSLDALKNLENLSTVSGLSNIAQTELSSDGKTLYAASSTGELAIFTRDTETGALTLSSTLTASDTQLTLVIDLKISQDGETLIMAGANGRSYTDTLAVFNRDPATGSLVYLESHYVLTVERLEISDDGKSVYAVDRGNEGIYVFSRDSNSGRLTQLNLVETTSWVEPYMFNISAMDNRGEYVFVTTQTSSSPHTLIAYQRDADGNLGSPFYIRDGQRDSDGNTVSLKSPSQINASPDGLTLYVTTSEGIVTFGVEDRAFVVQSTTSQANITSTALSSNGSTLYATLSDGTINRYSATTSGLVLLNSTAGSQTNASEIEVSADGGVIVTGSGINVLQEASTRYLEGSTAQKLSDAVVSDTTLDALDNGNGDYNGASFNVTPQRGDNAEDTLSFIPAGSLTLSSDGSQILDGGTAIANLTVNGSSLNITFTGQVSTALANQVLQQIGYSNTSSDAGSLAVMVLSFDNGQGASTSLNVEVRLLDINNAPTLTTTASDPRYSAQGNPVSVFQDTVIDTGERAQSVSGLELTIAGIQDGADEALVVSGTRIVLTQGNTGTTSSGLSYVVSLNGTTASVSLSGGNLSVPNAQRLVDGIGYYNGSSTLTGTDRVVSLTLIRDNGTTTNGGVDNTVLSLASTVTFRANNASVLTDVPTSLAYTEKAAALALLTGTGFSDIQLDSDGDYRDASIRIARSEGANPSDIFGLLEGNGFTLSADGRQVLKDGDVIASFNLVDGALILTFTSTQPVSATDANQVLERITYTNDHSDPGSQINLSLSINDGDGLTSTVHDISIAVTEINDAPEMSATPLDPVLSFGNNTTLFSDTQISTVEQGQSIIELRLEVSGLSDGSQERLNINGTLVELVNGTQTVGDYSYTVSLSAGTATLTITPANGISTEAAQTLIDGIRYSNASQAPTLGSRTVTLSSIRDSGGTLDGGTDVGSLNISSSVEVTANTAPGISNPNLGTVLTSPALTDPSQPTQLTPGSVDTGPSAMVTSSDGRFVYIVADKTLTIYTRTADGLVAQGSFSDDQYFSDRDVFLEGMDQVSSLTLSADGRFLYVAGFEATSEAGALSTITLYQRDVTTGALSYVGIAASNDTSSSYFGQMVISADGISLYAVSADSSNSGITTFTIDDQGGLTQSGHLSDGINQSSDVVISSDGRSVYVSASWDNGIAIFNRDTTTGALTYASSFIALGNGQNLTSTGGLGLSSDGNFLYVSDRSNNSIRILSRATDGSLTLTGTIRDGLRSTYSLTDVTLSADGSAVYLAHNGSDPSLLVYSRDATSGALTFVRAYSSSAGFEGLVSATDGSLYALSSTWSGSDIVILSSPTGTPHFTQGSDAVLLAPHGLVSDTELDVLNDGAGNYNGATLTLERASGASTDDRFGLQPSATLTLSSDGSQILLNDTAVATFSQSGGRLTITFTGDISQAQAQSVLQHLTYLNNAATPPAQVQLAASINDGLLTSGSANFGVSITAISTPVTPPVTGGDGTVVTPPIVTPPVVTPPDTGSGGVVITPPSTDVDTGNSVPATTVTEPVIAVAQSAPLMSLRPNGFNEVRQTNASAPADTRQIGMPTAMNSTLNDILPDATGLESNQRSVSEQLLGSSNILSDTLTASQSARPGETWQMQVAASDTPNTEVQLPPPLLASTQSSPQLRMDNGLPLPSWVRFDPRSGKLILDNRQLATAQRLNLVLITRDRSGQEQRTPVQIESAERTQDAATRQTPANTPPASVPEQALRAQLQDSAPSLNLARQAESLLESLLSLMGNDSAPTRDTETVANAATKDDQRVA